MTVLSEYTLLRRLCEADVALYNANSLPPELEACIKKISLINANPTSESLKDLRALATVYFGSVHDREKPNRIESIATLLRDGRPHQGPIFDDPDMNLLRGMTYDLRVGNEAYLSSKKTPTRLDLDESQVLVIDPGDFAIIITHEYLYIPADLMSFISVRMKYKSQGLISVSGFHVDPGFYGRIVFAVYNAGARPVVLKRKDPCFMILFEEIDKQALPPSSPSRYNGQTSISADLIAPLQGETVSLHRLALKVQRLEDRYKDILLTVVVGVIFAVIAAFLGSYFAAGGH